MQHSKQRLTMTLNETWKNCLRMWKWIVEQIDDKKQLNDNNYDNHFMPHLKEEFLKKHHFTKKIESDCFFCEYSNRGCKSFNCRKCPGIKVDPNFDCLDSSYHFMLNPQKFYRKLLRLNARRKAALRKKK